MSNPQEYPRELDLVAIGDLMIDFTCMGKSDAGMFIYERNPGGSAMNVAAQLVRLGGKAGAVACVGDDEHGAYLRDILAELGVDVANVRVRAGLGTRFLFVYFRDGGERYFSNYLGPRPDLEVDPDTVDYERIARAKVFLYSPLCNAYEKPIYLAARRAMEVAAKNGVMTAYDANFRFPYQDEKLRRLDIDAIRSSHILKMTAEEFEYYLEETDMVRGAERLLAGGARIVAVSMGRGGCFIRTRKAGAYQPAYAVEVMDTTGAGDSFMGALIYQVTRPGVDIDALTDADLDRMAEFANACASTSTTRRGSLMIMPNRQEVELTMKTVARAEVVDGAFETGHAKPLAARREA